MTGSIISALITGVLSLTGVIITNIISSNKMQQMLEKNQAVFEIKIENLTEEVKEHNNFAKRIPIVEEKIKNLENRVTKLECK